MVCAFSICCAKNVYNKRQRWRNEGKATRHIFMVKLEIQKKNGKFYYFPFSNWILLSTPIFSLFYYFFKVDRHRSCSDDRQTNEKGKKKNVQRKHLTFFRIYFAFLFRHISSSCSIYKLQFTTKRLHYFFFSRNYQPLL